MNTIQDFFQQELLGNSLQDVALFLAVLLLGILFRRIISRLSNRLLFRLIRKQALGVSAERFHELLNKPVGFTLMWVMVYLAFTRLSFPEEWMMAPHSEFGVNMFLFRGFKALLYVGIIWIGIRFMDFVKLILLERASQTEQKSSGQVVAFLTDAAKVLIVVFGVLIMLASIFAVDVGALVAGLGIGGLAVALAARESLENLFGSFTIFLDKPFVVGDMVRVGTTTGVIENVGFRSTRIRTLEKSFVTLPNKMMTDRELDNLTQRTSRRVNFNIGLTYGTRPEQTRAIVEDIQKYIDEHPDTNQDGRVRFHSFGPSSLDIMVMYFVETMDWTGYLDVRQEVNYRIMEIVHGHGAAFAFPSTSVYIEKNTG